MKSNWYCFKMCTFIQRHSFSKLALKVDNDLLGFLIFIVTFFLMRFLITWETFFVFSELLLSFHKNVQGKNNVSALKGNILQVLSYKFYLHTECLSVTSCLVGLCVLNLQFTTVTIHI